MQAGDQKLRYDLEWPKTKGQMNMLHTSKSI